MVFNLIVSSKDFNKWRTYLESEGYAEKGLSDEELLQAGLEVASTGTIFSITKGAIPVNTKGDV